MDTTSTALRIWEADPQAPAWAGMQAGLAWRRTQLAAQEQAVNMKQQAVGLIGQELQNKQRSMMIDRAQTEENRWAQDQATIAPWMQKTPEEMLKTPPPPVTSERGFATVHTIMGNAASAINARARLENNRVQQLEEADFIKRNLSLPPWARVPQNHSGPPNQDDWQKLSMAEEFNEYDKTAERLLAESKARNAGMMEKTVITPKGTTTTFSTPVDKKSGWGIGVHPLNGELYQKLTNDPNEVPRKIVSKGGVVSDSVKAQLLKTRGTVLENLKQATAEKNQMAIDSFTSDLTQIDDMLGRTIKVKTGDPTAADLGKPAGKKYWNIKTGQLQDTPP